MLCCCSLTFQIVFYICTGLFMVVAVLRYFTHNRPIIKRLKGERTYFSNAEKKEKEFPDLIHDHDKSVMQKDVTQIKPTVHLSVIVPAYNEEQRLPKMLDETIEYLEKQTFTYEIIVVDDGSRDRTSAIVCEFAERFDSDKIKLLKLHKNRGKGGAVRLGILSSSGEFVLFADADGAAKFEDYSKLEKCLTKDSKIQAAIGSRAHLKSEAIATRSFFRTLLMHAFHFIVWFFTVRTIRDTQCGFKLFRRQLAIELFNFVHVEGWAFDVELIYIIEYLNLPIDEVAINWVEVDGSKIVPVFSWIAMGLDVLRISFMYGIGCWQLPSRNSSIKQS